MNNDKERIYRKTASGKGYRRGSGLSVLAALECQGDCIVWTAGRSKSGYGMAVLIPGTRNSKQYLHRVSWEIHNERTIPDGLVIRHKCDNPPCINPDHLEIGTMRDNVHDAIERDIFRKNAALRHINVRYLREHPERIEEEAAKLGVSTRYLREIAKGWYKPGHYVYDTQ